MRLFIAIQLSEEMKQALVQAQGSLRGQGVRGNFTPRENLHLTLAFLGELRDPSPAIEAMAALAEAGAPVPFMLRLGQGGNFGNLLWAGMEGGQELESLAQSLRAALKEHGVPFDRKKFRPHVTLVRKAVWTRTFTFDIPAAEMEATYISLMKSERVGGRMVYTEIYRQN